MPKIKNKEVRFKILNECLRDPHRLYTYESLLAELNRQLAMLDDCLQVSERTLREDLKDMMNVYGIELDQRLSKQRPVVLRYADLSDSINKLSMDEANALRKTIDMLLQSPEPRPIQYDYIRVCLQQVLKDQALDVANPAVRFADNLDQKGREHFVDLCGYIFEKQTLEIEYCPFGAESREYKVSPYLLKQYNERWFLFGWDADEGMMLNLALDRIVGLKKAAGRYVPCTQDWDAYFDEIVGVTKYEGYAVETIKLKVQADRYPYIETKPLNPSQRLVKEKSTDVYKVVEIKVRPNNELESLIRSYGDAVEVIEPLWLREKMIDNARRLMALYACEK